MKNLKNYSTYLKQNFLKEIVKEKMDLLESLDIPQKDIFQNAPMTEKGLIQLLTAFEKGNALELVQENLKKWENNELPGIPKEKISASDFFKIFSIQSPLLLKYIPHYTRDIDEGFKIAAEIEEYYISAEDIAFNTLLKIRKEIEKKLEEAVLELSSTTQELKRSNSELSHFAYMASHDLQEPLRMISSYLQLLQRRYLGKLDKTALEFIEYAVDGTKRMRKLIEDLLEYSRVGSKGSKYVECNLNEVLDNVTTNLEMTLKESGAKINYPEMPVIMADISQMGQVFQNLIGNALKFRAEESPEISIDFKENPKDYLFSVKDNGIGIAKEYHDRIFIIFQRLHSREDYEGTGIGLAVVKKIIEQHGGKIWLESEEGKGTTFFFTIKKNLSQQEN